MFYIGMILIIHGRYDLSKMLKVFALITFSISTAGTIITTLPGFSKGRQAATDLLSLFELPERGPESEGDLECEIKGKIDFNSVLFSYATRPSVKVLRALDLKTEAGNCVAVVGASGSGKSTLASLVQRLYHAEGGSISVDDRPITTYSISHLRSQVSVVTQQSALFNTTIAENITYGLTKDDLETLSLGTKSSEWCQEGGIIFEAARQARLLKWILALPLGFETRLGQDTISKLSGGQAQRMQLARTFVRLPLTRIIILDECTSALDVENGRAILEALVGKGRQYFSKHIDLPTVLVVTHKVDAMKLADRVVVLREGKVAEEGTFDQLMSRHPVSELWKLVHAGGWHE